MPLLLVLIIRFHQHLEKILGGACKTLSATSLDYFLNFTHCLQGLSLIHISEPTRR